MGIDTSAYTTSLAVVTRDQVVFDQRMVLSVPQGQRGLRSSEAVYRHVLNFPILYEKWRQVAENLKIPVRAVAVSTRPRPIADAYLPTFKVGEAYAQVVSLTLNVPLIATSHQEGHIRAGLFAAGRSFSQRFYALHVSGGTTELLQVEPREPGAWNIQLLGGSDDLYAGQFVDRIGVALGLAFPAGPELERLALGSVNPLLFNTGAVRHKDGRVWISFSGLEAQAQRALKGGYLPEDVARGVEIGVGKALANLITAGAEPGPLLVVGGVAANETVREIIRHLTAVDSKWDILFGTPQLSRDNAVGVAWIGWDTGY
ncbi:MAG: peptidase M22 [Sulfobacillus benefaciens]|uniref:N(6)-L-threonylcarbamoyladenine synthase n=1 Tax=Sulfobacillus benefaciens TaxID=453960 RepID=A0A2T2XL62_9FIRM|nr:MAG: peptidase M22 [Sulfobacillus benefaciens]